MLAPPMAALAAASAPPRSAWQRWRAHVGSPASRYGGGSRSGPARAAPHTEAPRVCARARQHWRAAADLWPSGARLWRANGVPRKGQMGNVDRPLSNKIPQPGYYGQRLPVVDLGGRAASRRARAVEVTLCMRGVAFLSEHTLRRCWSIFRLVKMVLSFCKSPGLQDRVLSNMRIGAPMLMFLRAMVRVPKMRHARCFEGLTHHCTTPKGLFHAFRRMRKGFSLLF